METQNKIQDLVETVVIESSSLCIPRCSLYHSLIVDFYRKKF